MNHPEQDKTAPRRVGVREFRGDMTALLHEAQQGTSFLITSRDQVVA